MAKAYVDIPALELMDVEIPGVVEDGMPGRIGDADSTWRMPRLMILSPWAMIFRSFPITDFSPLEGALIDGCTPPGRVVRASSAFGSTEELRVNIEIPQ